ncbi:Bifunctional protein BirA [Bacteroidales bacterium Barb6XT]|nr:Bifunctional protein BirA [Bacteroidales bacterium Barb6XT]
MLTKENKGEDGKDGYIPQIICLPETTSTNAALREHAYPEETVIWADYQSAGRGQTGTGWESEPNKNLTFSIVLYPHTIPADSWFLLSQISALSVKEALDRYTGGITVKWPNDIYWNDRKICGILIENDLSGSVLSRSIVGMGVNINQTIFTGNAPNPVSLAQITGYTCDREAILHCILCCFHRNFLLLLQRKFDIIRIAYRSALYRNEGFYSYKDASGSFEAAIEVTEPSGRLLLRLHDGSIRSYAFKEVTFLLPSVPLS